MPTSLNELSNSAKKVVKYEDKSFGLKEKSCDQTEV